MSQYDAIYDSGFAVGESDIELDKLTFRFRDETFEFSTLKAYPYVDWNGYFYTAPIDKLRELEREAAY